MTKALFWSSFALILYPYAGYPLLLWIESRFLSKPTHKGVKHPKVSVVIAARNEERTILARLDNLVAQSYPTDQVEIIVVSDGSTDRTCDVVRACAQPNVRLIPLRESHGKAAALNQAVAQAEGEIVVFADARQRFAPEVLTELVANFADPTVGCVSGELLFLREQQSEIAAEMGLYWRYEKGVRKLESRTGSVVGATGAIYAIRKELYVPLPPGTILDDVLTPLNVMRQGQRCIFDDRAKAYDTLSADIAQEWPRKVRTLAGNWQLLSLSPTLLLPWRNPCWWRLVSHKLLRLLVPVALLVLLGSGWFLPDGFYRIATLLQLCAYGLALTGALLPITRRRSLVNFCYVFVVLNAAALAGFWTWARGRSGSSWKASGVRHG